MTRTTPVSDRKGPPSRQTLLSIFGLNPFRIGGQEAFIRELSRQIGEIGWNSVVCFSDRPPEPIRNFLDLPNVQLEIIRDPHELRLRSLNDADGIFRKHRPRIVHLHFTGFISAYPLMARLSRAERVYFTDHSSRPPFHVPRQAPLWKRRIARLVLNPLTHVICPSEYGYRCMTSLDMLPVERFVTIHNGVDLSRIDGTAECAQRFRLKYSIPRDRKLVVQVSWIIPEKGIEDLLLAARHVLTRDPNAHFAVAGDGPCLEYYVRLAQELGIDGHVTFTGLLTDPFIEGVYAAADVVCQVSRWEELFGCTISEAMAYGKPVVATRVGGIPELVGDGDTGFLAPRGDTAQIAEKILQLIQDDSLRERMGRAGRVIVERKFDLRVNVSRLLKLYGLRLAEDLPHIGEPP